MQRLGSRHGSGMVKARAAGSSAVDNREDRDNHPSNRPPSSKIRNSANRNSRNSCRLRKAFLDFYVDTKRSVLIAQPDDGDVSVHVVFHLDDLLLRRTHIRNISDGEVTSNLLLDGNTCRGVLFRARRTYSCETGINAKARYPKQTLQAPA